MNHDIMNFYFLIPCVHPVQIPWKTDLFFFQQNWPPAAVMSETMHVINKVGLHFLL